jgi:hypothetical protein
VEYAGDSEKHLRSLILLKEQNVMIWLISLRRIIDGRHGIDFPRILYLRTRAVQAPPATTNGDLLMTDISSGNFETDWEGVGRACIVFRRHHSSLYMSNNSLNSINI